MFLAAELPHGKSAGVMASAVAEPAGKGPALALSMFKSTQLSILCWGICEVYDAVAISGFQNHNIVNS